ncbi:hypothetical protein BDQ12DRAFT_315564 [Crucibulum laeve]|uniref:Uncharacterized protein n=1 Tax=Crucibulum laeve TaxID=68775 RepID=A0A5C3LG06_9AGAR|nr:hypothetical protein BDQ12DRAFT_315564 [Crucibulum laeve]
MHMTSPLSPHQPPPSPILRSTRSIDPTPSTIPPPVAANLPQTQQIEQITTRSWLLFILFFIPFPPWQELEIGEGWFALGANSCVLQPPSPSPSPNAMGLNKNSIKLNKSNSSAKNKLIKPRRPPTIHVQCRLPPYTSLGSGMVSPPASLSPPGESWVRNPVSPISPFSATPRHTHFPQPNHPLKGVHCCTTTAC